MTKKIKAGRQDGFAVWELLLALVVIAIIVVAGYAVFKHQNSAETNSPGTSATTKSAPAGTTGSIEQGVTQEEQSESSAYGNYSTTTEQNSDSDAGALNNLAGAYDENNL